MGSFFEMSHIIKKFGDVEILHNVDFQLERGEIRALLGANGAGKSTLMRIIAGASPATSGSIKMNGTEVHITDPIAAQQLGIAMVHQERSLVPTMTVLQNIYLGREIKQHGLMDTREMLQKYTQLCEKLNFYIPAHATVRDLSVAQQQMVEIIRVLSLEAQIIILDEPTTSLTNGEKDKLFALIKQLKEEGKTIVYISHILEEIFLLTDTATIMRNGDIVGSFKTSDLTKASISEYMSGMQFIESTRESYCQTDAAPVLEVKNLSGNKYPSPVSFSVRPGEIVGLAGLVGAGRSELARAIFGADKSTGEILVDGTPVQIKSPADGIKHGIGFISEDRKQEGLILQHPLYKNAAVTQLHRMKKGGWLSATVAKDYMEEHGRKLSIKMNSVNDPASSLSGGNQQKVVLSKWLMDDLKVLIFDEPTKGIDIGAKEDVFHAIEERAKQGMAIIFISSDLQEVLRVSDRVLIMYEGKIIDERPNSKLTEKDILDAILQYQDWSKNGKE